MYAFTEYFRGLMERVDEMNMQILQIKKNTKYKIYLEPPQRAF